MRKGDFMRKRISSLFAVFALAVGSLFVLTPTEAHAGTCTLKIICGDIANGAGSKTYIYVYDGWSSDPNKPAGNRDVVHPGKKGRFKDDDGYCNRKGYKSTATIRNKISGQVRQVNVGSGKCLKVNDFEKAAVYTWK